MYIHKLDYVVFDYLKGKLSFEDANKRITNYKALVSGVDYRVIGTWMFDDVYTEYSCGNITFESAREKVLAIDIKLSLNNKPSEQAIFTRTENVRNFIESQFSTKDRTNAMAQPICTKYIQSQELFSTCKETLLAYKISIS